VFGVKHYLRYAQLSSTCADPPQKEWRITLGHAEAQTARFAEETEGSITAVINSLRTGSLVALDWLQVAVRSSGREHVEHPCQKLEPISQATEEKLLATHTEVMVATPPTIGAQHLADQFSCSPLPQVEILGLTDGMETLLRSARSQPEALAALHAAQQHPGALQALGDVVKNGLGAASNHSKDLHAVALLKQLEGLGLLDELPHSTGRDLASSNDGASPPGPSPISTVTGSTES
jgi:hypothetical protein